MRRGLVQAVATFLLLRALVRASSLSRAVLSISLALESRFRLCPPVMLRRVALA
jgi:hypothetical protein